MGALSFASIAELASRLRAGDVSPQEVVEDVLARIERRRDLNAFVTVTADLARAQAEEDRKSVV